MELKRDLAEERSGDLKGFLLEGVVVVVVWGGGFGEILFWELRGGGGGGDGGGAGGFLISCVEVRERNDDGIFPIFFGRVSFVRRKVFRVFVVVVTLALYCVCYHWACWAFTAS